ncbi:amino acid ABC transporter substrate-binding protein, PAAT family [Oceanobacillus limi]|uniref:Amino acid ABC transporter substrate-binding protein, PAAT family n=1 Tax=Oceanobacillus limi TaxID=930131 RepID=A0A1I0DYA1_9BACI|nr:transporter substrate-binding domain-containing protein [Oceanobacillus limi]SET37692.1 amino acid ABC transporter substrate-binding protein, PAAT family [Oceanobacillus limi]
MKKINLFIVLLVGAVLLVACADSEEGATNSNEGSSGEDAWNRIQEAGEIVVGTSGTLIAASYYEGDEETEDQLTGYEVETMREIAKRLDLDISFEIIGVDNVLPAIKSGRIDISSGTITDKRKEEFDFSDPYKYSYITMAVRKEDNSGIESLEDLEGKKNGGGATTIYSQIAEQFGAEVVTYGNAPNEAYLRDVDNGRTDVVINDYYLTKFGVAAFPDFDIHLHPDLNFNLTTSGVIVPKGEDTLREKINEALQEMREDGTLSELAIKFYEEDASVEPEKEIIEIDDLDI